MTEEFVTATTTVEAAADQVFAVLADPTTHAAIDGTGWVRESLTGEPLSHSGQIFRVAMYHPNHPDGDYEMANKVQAFDSPRTISWVPGQDNTESGTIEYGGWSWRYDLEPAGPSATTVTLTYDWSAASPAIREVVPFPPFDDRHLDNSLNHLAEITLSRSASVS